MNIVVPMLSSTPLGPLTREAAQAQLHGAALARDNAEAIGAAARELVPPPRLPRRFLAKLTAAEPIDGEDNQWTYTGQAAVRKSDGTAVLVEDEWGLFENGINLDEYGNTATVVAGCPLPTGATIGPVGSTLVEGTWTTEGLDALVMVDVDYLEDGSPVVFFSRANPGACPPEGA